MSKKSISKILTEVELEVMNILWQINEGSVREVLSKISDQRNLAYTSVATMLRILEQKNIVKSHKQGKSHIYSPVLLKKNYEENTLQHVVANVFAGNPTTLVKRLVNTTKISESERQQIKDILADL